MKVSAAIFDLNGTVVDDERLYGQAFRQVLRDLGKKVDKEIPHTLGIGVRENWPRLLAKYKIKTKRNIEELTRTTQEEYLKKLSKIKLMLGFIEFVELLKQRKIVVALATSNSWWITDKLISELGLENYFDIITTSEEVNFKKPDPELFLVTAEKLNIEPERCLVFEDANAGIEAAHQAGMKVVGIGREKDRLSEADIVAVDYFELIGKASTFLD